jgi:hypothetical protein
MIFLLDRVSSLSLSLSKIYSQPYEENFMMSDSVEFTLQNWNIVFAIAGVYLLLVFSGPVVMKDCSAWDIKMPLAIWNAGLSVFSLVGLFRLVGNRQ